MSTAWLLNTVTEKTVKLLSDVDKQLKAHAAAEPDTHRATSATAILFFISY